MFKKNHTVGVCCIVLAVLFAAISGLALAQAPEGQEYVVQADDWLSKIAEKKYGDPLAYPAIVEATNAKAAEDDSFTVIDNPDLIEVGQKLWLPTTLSGAMDSIAPAAGGSRLTEEQLKNATYSGIYDEPVTLTEGRYEGEPFVEGGASRPIVEYLSELYGDLDGDGVEDAAVFLVESSGGTGNFIYVAAQLNQNGLPVDTGAVWIEDRIQIKAAAIENGQIKLEITAEGPGDAACCKSHKAAKSYALQNGQLAEIPGEEQALERISAADLDGTTWTLLELDVDQPTLPDAPVTLSFAGDQLSGSGGCNTYSGGFTLGEDNPFVMTIGPVVSTQMACPEPVLNQETAYLTALQSVTQWGYVVGDLAIYYDKGDGVYGRLLFTPPPTAESSQVEMLTGATWQWVSFTDPVQQFEVEQPESYTLTFQPDGTLQIKADCNQVVASYSASEEGALSIEPGPATMAACPPESRGDEFVQNLSFASGYFFQDGHLFIDMMADGGTLEFSSTTP
jgi:heat shock protein HslJ